MIIKLRKQQLAVMNNTSLFTCDKPVNYSIVPYAIFNRLVPIISEMRCVVILLAVFTCSGVHSDEINDDSIVLLHVFSRHGARTPELKDVYPNDPHKLDSFLPMGWGQLTDNGKLLAYNVGKFLRARYNSFLGEKFHPDIVHAQSTDYDRTKMTALLILAGLFPPPPSQTWSRELPWLPIPVAYKEHNKDYFLKRPNEYCPVYFEELKRALHSQEVLDYLKSKKSLLDYLSAHTGKSVKTTSDVFGIFQTLTAENTMNMTLPEWTKTVYPNKIEEVAKKQYQLENSTPLLKKLNGGRSIQKILENIMAKTENSLQPENRKMFLYTGHENNIINILTALGWEVTDFPEYSATVIFELHFLKETKEFAIKILYLKNPIVLEEKQIEGCDVLCRLKKFIELTKDVIPRNYTSECASSFNLD